VVTVVGQELQVGKRLVRVGEGRSSPRAMIRAIATASTASDLPCDPLRRRSLNSERGGHLPYLLAGRGKRPAEPGAIGSRPFHPDGSGLAIVPRPLEQCAMTSWIVRELFDPKDPAELAPPPRRGSPCASPLRSTPHYPLLPRDRLRCGPAEDMRASGSSQPSIKSLPPSRSGRGDSQHRGQRHGAGGDTLPESHPRPVTGIASLGTPPTVGIHTPASVTKRHRGGCLVEKVNYEVEAARHEFIRPWEDKGCGHPAYAS
jgi:hypothetical protein